MCAEICDQLWPLEYSFIYLWFLHIQHETQSQQQQQHKKAFFVTWNDVECSAQQSCSYLTPLLHKAGENTIYFQLLYLLTVDPVSKHTKEPIQSTTHSSPVFVLGFNYLCVCVCVFGGCSTTQLSRADVDLGNLLSLGPLNESPHFSWPTVCVLYWSRTELSLRVWKSTKTASFDSVVNAWVTGTFWLSRLIYTLLLLVHLHCCSSCSPSPLPDFVLWKASCKNSFWDSTSTNTI